MKPYILFIIGLKIIFMGLLLIHVYLNYKQKLSDLDKKILYWKERVEFWFITCMALLMLYIFNPRSANAIMIDNETKLLLFVFALLILITENWKIFFNESKLNLKQSY